jgi:hypothetical protein
MNQKGPVINQNVTTYNQSGGIAAHTVNVDRRVRRTMNDELKGDRAADRCRSGRVANEKDDRECGCKSDSVAHAERRPCRSWAL